MAPITGSDDTKTDAPVPPPSPPARTHHARHDHGRARGAAGAAGVEHRGLARRAPDGLPRPSVPDEAHAGQLVLLRGAAAQAVAGTPPRRAASSASSVLATASGSARRVMPAPAKTSSMRFATL